MQGLTNALRVAMAVASVAWLWAGGLPTAVVAVVSAGLTYLPYALSRAESTRRKTELGLACYLSLHVFVGIGLGLYEAEAGFDKVMHFIAFGTFTAILLTQLPQLARRHEFSIPARLAVASALVVALGGGAAWEVFEYSIDRTGWFTSQRGLDDTMLDLIANSVGALVVAAAFIAMQAKPKRVVA